MALYLLLTPRWLDYFSRFAAILLTFALYDFRLVRGVQTPRVSNGFVATFVWIQFKMLFPFSISLPERQQDNHLRSGYQLSPLQLGETFLCILVRSNFLRIVPRQANTLNRMSLHP